MELHTFKICYILFLSLLIFFFFTKDLNIDYLFSKKIKKIDTLVLVNKKNHLDKNYIPEDLVLLDTSYSMKDKYVKKEVKENLEKLIIDSKKDGMDIVVVSAYRSYDYQDMLFKGYKKTYSYKYALNCSAKRGHSEHQTGLAIDVMGENKDYNQFKKTKEYQWMMKNAYKYGFILRYPKGKEKITGFKEEPWHFRYVGDKAKEIYFKNITLEEYKKDN